MIEFLPVIILVFSFLVLLIVGVPVAWCIAMSSLFTLMVAMPFSAATTTVSQRIATGLDSFALLAIPFFILSGQIMSKGGIANRLISFAKTLVGFLPGGLALINIVSAMLMGAIAGSAMASASAMGTILGPEMEKEGYSKEFGAAVNITSSTTGLVIPPSNTLIVYSLASGGVSIAALFLAGYIPGILTGLLMMIVAMVWAKKNKYPVGKRSSLKEVFVKFIDALPSLLLLVIVIGGIIGGVFTATEASAVAVLYTVLLSFYYKELSLKDLSNALLSISDNKIIILLMINLILLMVGVFMDATPAVLIFTPIFLPIVTALGMDPTHFGIVLMLNLCIGLCTPPVGSVLFVGVGIAKTTITKVIKPLIPLFLVMILSLFLVTYIPQLSLWLPDFFGV